MKNTRRYIDISVFAALAAVLGIIDRQISVWFFPFVPGVKIGLANIIVLYSLLNFHFIESFILVILKIIIVGLIFGSLMTFIISGVACLLSYLVMLLLVYLTRNRKRQFSVVAISAAGGFIHITSQLLVITLIYQLGNSVISYGIILILISFMTSIVIGIIVQKFDLHIKKTSFQKYN